jgi:hypothetical protein
MAFRILENPPGHVRVTSGYISRLFPTKDEAISFRTDDLKDPQGERYSICEVDDSGRLK